jgi:hypothetical protein
VRVWFSDVHGYHVGRVVSIHPEEEALTVYYPYDDQCCEHERKEDDWEPVAEVLARAQEDPLAFQLLGQMIQGKVHTAKELTAKLESLGNNDRRILPPPA